MAHEIICLECGHGNELVMMQDGSTGEWFCEGPVDCEECREPLDDGGPSESECRASERRQMGITS